MRAAVALRDVVRKAQHRLVIGIGPLHRDLDKNAVLLALDRNRRRMQRLFRAVEIVDKSFQPAVVMEGGGLWLDPAQIGQFERDPAIEEGQFAQPVLQRREVEAERREGLAAWGEGDLGAGLLLSL